MKSEYLIWVSLSQIILDSKNYQWIKSDVLFAKSFLLSGLSLERKKALKRIYTVLSSCLFRKKNERIYVYVGSSRLMQIN